MLHGSSYVWNILLIYNYLECLKKVLNAEMLVLLKSSIYVLLFVFIHFINNVKRKVYLVYFLVQRNA